MKTVFTFECLRGHRNRWELEAREDGSPIYEVKLGVEIRPMCLTCHLDNRCVDGVNVESESMAPLEPGRDSLTDQQREDLRASGRTQTKWSHP